MAVTYGGGQIMHSIANPLGAGTAHAHDLGDSSLAQ
jgi:hypothetical protein